MNLLKRVRLALDRYSREQKTLTELSQLSDRELADIGISRYDIRAIAREAADHGYVDIYDWRDRAAPRTGAAAPRTLKAA